MTMHEVARHIGVAPMTVSRVLSGDANVKPETRQRVEAAIKELGYTPNVSARNLAKAASVHIGLLYNNPSSAYMNELLVGVLEQSSHAGCQIVLEKCSARSERTVIEKLLRDRVYDGACFLLSTEASATTGDYVEPHPELTFAKFVTPLVAQVSAICAPKLT